MRLVLAVGLMAMVAGCSLLVSTSGLSDGKPDAAAPPHDDAAAGLDDGATPLGNDGGGTADAEAGAPQTELPGLVAAWLFDDGTAKDSSGQAHDGLFEGDATVTATDRGKAMHVSGHGVMHIEALADKAFPATGTISLWFQWTTMIVAEEQGFFDGWDNARDHLFVRHANDAPIGTVQIVLQKPDTYEIQTTFDLAKSTWTHVVVTWDAVAHNGRVFADGKNILTDNYASGMFTPDGQHVRFGDELDGFIDDIRLFDRVLSDSEISGLR